VNNEDIVKEYLKTRDPKLREQVILKFIPIVKYIIGRLNLSVRNRTELEDIHSAGVMGLIRALQDYDPSKNTTFKTYATWRVKGNILDYLRKIDIVSRSDRAKLREIEDVIARLTLKFNREPSAFEVSNEMKIDLRECHRLLELTQLNFMLSLDNTQSYDGEDMRLSEVIQDHNAVGPLEKVSRENIIQVVKEVILKLPERQRLIVLMYYNDEMTLLEIGKVLGLSESRVSRLLGKAILTIRSELRKMEVEVPDF